MLRILLLRSGIALLLFLLIPSPAFPQGAAGSVTGLITDPSGASVPQALVTLTNRETGVKQTAAATESGLYRFPSVRIGEYDITVEAQGFQSARVEGLRVETAVATQRNITLQVGATAETVSVTADLPLLQSDNSSMGTTVNRSLLDRVPFQLAGTNRDVTSFMRLVPGVSNAGNFGINITGGRQHAGEVLIDGVTNTYRGAVNTPFSIRPSMTSVSEFRVETAVPAAEFGRTSSGVVLITTKSGTNELHGNLEFLLRNNVLDARRYNARIADITRQGEGSVSLGGPVRLSKLYDGRNRTFFFADHMIFRRINQPQGVVRTVATRGMRSGDFSATGLAVYDPLSGSAASRSQFPGNVIPASRISAFGRAMLDVLPAPNLSGSANNFTGAQINIENMRSLMLRIDHRFNDRHSVMLLGRPTWNERNNYNGPWGYARLEGFYDLPYAPHINLQDDFILKPNLLNKFTFGYTNWFSLFLQTPEISYRVPGAYGSGFPALRFTGQGLSMIGENVDRTVGSNTINLQDAISWTTGRHSFKFGFRYDFMEDNTQTLGNRNGTYTFAPFATGLSGVSASGHAFASMLLGAPNTANMQFGLPFLGRSQALGFFAQDDWRVNRVLTINYGLRWEMQQPWYDGDGNISSLDLTKPNEAAGGLPGAMVFAGSGPGRLGVTRLVDNYRNGWGPRLGVAYQVTPTTALRAGAGVFYAPRRYAGVYTEGFSANVTLSSLDGGYTPAFFVDTGWPQGVAVQPPFINPALVNGRAASWVNPSASSGSGRLPRTTQIQVSLQQRVRSGVVELGWVSTQGRHIANTTLENLNQVDPKHLALGDLLRRSITDPAVQAQGFRAPYAGFTGTLAQALRPYPQFQAINYIDSPSGNSSYHALLAKYEQRFTSGLALLASYTFSKFISDVEMVQSGTSQLQNALDRRAERSVTNIDIPHRLITSVAYELPFGKGKRWMGKGWGSHLAGGFAIYGILSYESGAPLRITIPNGLPIFNGQLRPNLVAGVDPFVKNDHGAFRPQNGLSGEQGDLMLNRAAFATPAAYTFGNLAPFLPTVRSFGYSNEDLSLSKRNYFGERQFIEFRTDWFNAPNRVQLTAPITDLTNPAFGRINGQKSARIIQFGIRYGF
jgi:hypothetical protein